MNQGRPAEGALGPPFCNFSFTFFAFPRTHSSDPIITYMPKQWDFFFFFKL